MRYYFEKREDEIREMSKSMMTFEILQVLIPGCKRTGIEHGAFSAFLKRKGIRPKGKREAKNNRYYFELKETEIREMSKTMTMFEMLKTLEYKETRNSTAYDALVAFLKRKGIYVSRKSISGTKPKGWRKDLIHPDGYVSVFVGEAHHLANCRGYCLKHRLVMEKKIGRWLTDKEVVHHKDDNPLNNDPENLELFQDNGSHLHETRMGKCPDWTPEGKRRLIDSAFRQNKRICPDGCRFSFGFKEDVCPTGK
jgi:hypothetical protein